MAADATGRFPIGFHESDSKSEHGHEEHGHKEHGHDDDKETIIGNFIVEPN